MTVLATLKDGRIIASASFTATWITSGSRGYLSATLAELRKVEKALGIHLTTDAMHTVSPHSGPYYSGNVVGLSVYVGAAPGAATGTSVGGEVTAIGF